MKIALCFYGCSPLDTLRGSSSGLKINYTIKHWLKYVIIPNKPDIFIHCWSVKSMGEYVENFKPTRYKFEQPKHFPVHRKQRIMDYGKTNDEIMKSVHYSLQQSVQMKKQIEHDHNFKYDVVMIARLDIMWFNQISFKNFNMDYIHISPWNFANDINSTRKMDYILDYFMIAKEYHKLIIDEYKKRQIEDKFIFN